MDGSTSGYLHEAPVSSRVGDMFGFGRTDGILYIEDFDAPPPVSQPSGPEAATQAAAPVFTADDLAAAHAAGREEGMSSALSDAMLLQAQLQAAATQALSDSIAATRSALARLVAQRADDTARTLLAILQAAIPHAMQLHAKGEIQAVIAALLPGLRNEAELRVRAHPELADFVRQTLAESLTDGSLVLSVSADDALLPGDIQLFWGEGSAQRDCRGIYADIVKALAPLGLPALEEIHDVQRD
jgi:flagellar biosynthesis/type III secretory pathway protein FliH